MKTTIFDISALKKATKQSQLNYYKCADDKVIVWDSKGLFAIMVNQFIFDAEIIPALPTFPQSDAPRVIKDIFTDPAWETVPEIRKTSILYQFPDDKIANIFYNNDKDYITAFNVELLNIIKYIENYTVRQVTPKQGALFSDGGTKIVIMPMYCKDLKEKIISDITKE
jgi:hypothetical protein